MTRHYLISVSISVCAAAGIGCGTSSGGSGSGGAAGHAATGGGTPVSGSGGTPSGSGGVSTGAAGAGGSAPTGAGGNAPTGAGGSAPTGPYTWKNVAIGGGGFVSGIVFSPAQNGLAYARTDVGGFYRWNGATSTWTPLTDMFPMSQGNTLGGESIAPDPTDANVVYAAAGMYESSGNGVILRSTNQGATWTVNTIGVPMGGNDPGRGMGERLAVDPNNDTILLFGSRGSGLYKSTNSGAAWTKVTTFPATGDINIPNSYGGSTSFGLPVVVFDKRNGSSAGSKIIYVAAASTAAGSNLYQSSDGGASWSEISGGPSGLMAHHAAVGSDGTLWLAYGSNYGPSNTGTATLSGQVWKYSATGTWTNVTPAGWPMGATANVMGGGISVDAQNANHVIVSTLDSYAPDRLYATTNGGTSWSVVGQPPAYGNPGSTYEAQGAQFWYAGGTTQIGQGATNWVEAVALDPFDPNHAMYGTGAGIWNSIDIGSATGTAGQGATWTFSDAGLEETVPIFLGPAVNGAFLGAIGDLGGMRNTNLDAYSTTGEYDNPIQNNTRGLDFAENNPGFVVRVGSSTAKLAASDVAYSMDNGVTWQPAANGLTGYAAGNMGSVAVAADGGRFVVSPTSGHGGAAYTTNNGSSWTPCMNLPDGAIVAADRVTVTTFYGTNNGTLYVSTNGGASFSAANTFSGNGAPRPVFGQAGEVWVAGKGGALYRFTNAGANKTQIANVSAAWGVGFGKAATGQTHPATYIIGTVGGQYGFFRSDDGGGTNWARINDDQHQFGSLQGDYIAGDETTFGRVYLTTGGRGYIYGDPNP